jgi:glycosyltransferase involved in cell wall biosynthesis
MACGQPIQKPEQRSDPMNHPGAPFKVVHLSTYDSVGGAAIAAHRLHKGLLEAGVDSRMLVMEKHSGSDSVSLAVPQRQLPLWKRLLKERWDRVCREHHFSDGIPDAPFHNIHSGFRPDDFRAVLDADVVHLHWTCGFLDWPSTLPWLAERKPIIWTFHDMHAPLGVLNYRPEGELPEAFAKWEDEVLRQKKGLLDKIPADRLHVIAPSRWMAEVARKSPVFNRFRVHHIPCGLSTETFKPLNREAVRELLGLPPGRTAIGFVAQNLADKRKGMKVLTEALRSLVNHPAKPLLVTAGGTPQEIPGIESLHLGSFDGEKMLALFYNALDLFICPSLQDNLPNTVLESMSCGVPVVAFQVGGLPDMVRPGLTGWLAQAVGDAAQLASTIAEALDRGSLHQRMGTSCREVARREYALVSQAKCVVNVYENFFEAPSRASSATWTAPRSAFASPS